VENPVLHAAKYCCVLCVLSLLARPSPAQNLVANPSFESGASQPTGWTLLGSGRWETFGHSGARSVSLTNATGGCDDLVWQSAAFPIQPGRPYLVNLCAVSSNAAEVARARIDIGTPGNIGWVERYVYPPADWRSFPLVTLLPRNQSTATVRLTSCVGAGALGFDDVEVLPVEPVHALGGGNLLGAGESVSSGKYSFAPDWLDVGQGLYRGNYSRALEDFTASFNTFYTWQLSEGTHITFRHEYGNKTITNATAQFTSYYSGGGTLFVEFSRDGTNWVVGTNFSPGPVHYVTFTNVVRVPSSLLPATNIYSRLRTDASGVFYMNYYRFDADMTGASIDATGKSLLFAQRVPAQAARLVGVSEDLARLTLSLANPAVSPVQYSIQWKVQGPAGARTWGLTNQVPANTTNAVALNFTSLGWGENTLNVEVKNLGTGATNLSAFAFFPGNLLSDESFGATLPSPVNCSVWWCEGTYKVGRDRAPPIITNSTVTLAAARNEYEPFQFVLRPDVTLVNAWVWTTPFLAVAPNNPVSIASTNVAINVVEYVPIITPSDYSCATGWHPDPLIPWTGYMTFPAGTNQPIWVTVHVPPDAPAGEYTATISVQHSTGVIWIPVRLRVFDFSLSDVTHSKSAFGVRVDEYWHGMTNSPLMAEVFELHLQNYRQHRVDPFRAHDYAALYWTESNNSNDVSYAFDFDRFDAAMERYFEGYGFNSFRLDKEMVPETLNGEPRFSIAYREHYKRFLAPLMKHLRERGWLKWAYCFWIDEPGPELVASTVAPGMAAIGEAAPGLRRTLTREPLPELYGLVDTWWPFTGWLAMAQKPAREVYGEDFWWYISGVPGAPYPMYFTDHPAINPRMRFWMSEKFGFQGEAHWSTSWWIGVSHAPINPWTNTLTRLYDGSMHGNGNGVFFYPPSKVPPTSPLIAPPINSLRWEIVREGIEDREYFWLLQQLVQRREPILGANHPSVLQAKAAREAALGIILSRTYYDSDPQKLYAGRLAIANAIEALDDGAPMIVRDPFSRAAALGSNVVLRAEAIGWPPPAYQWRHAGTNVPGATTAFLTLNSFHPTQLGDWQVVASNVNGSATSAVATLAGLWVETPQIIAQSVEVSRRVGDRTVLEVSAVSELPITYRWYLNGVLVAGATNAAIAIADLTANSAGIYTVTASNQAGLAASGPIKVSVMPSYTSEPPGLAARWAGVSQGLKLELPVDNRPRTVLSSSDLMNWAARFVLPPSGLPQSLLDSTATNRPHQFYRIRTD